MDQASALQALLARVTGASAGLEFGFGGGSRYRQLLEDLQADGDDSRQEAALRKLTEMLLMGNEETLAGFRPDQFVPALHNLLQSEYRPQVCAHLVSCIRLDFTRAHTCCWTLACSRRTQVRRTFCFRVLGWVFTAAVSSLVCRPTRPLFTTHACTRSLVSRSHTHMCRNHQQLGCPAGVRRALQHARGRSAVCSICRTVRTLTVR